MHTHTQSVSLFLILNHIPYRLGYLRLPSCQDTDLCAKLYSIQAEKEFGVFLTTMHQKLLRLPAVSQSFPPILMAPFGSFFSLEFSSELQFTRFIQRKYLGRFSYGSRDRTSNCVKQYSLQHSITFLVKQKSRKFVTIYSSYIAKILRALQLRLRSRDPNSICFKQYSLHHSITFQVKQKSRKSVTIYLSDIKKTFRALQLQPQSKNPN